LLLNALIAPAGLCTAARVRPVLERLLVSHAHWVTAHPQTTATVAVISSASPSERILAPCVQEWVPITVNQCCRQPLVRWKVLPSTFFTLARGVRPGNVVCLRCPTCAAVFAGCWKWPKVHEDSRFPEGFHTPVLASTACAGSRWFFATPQVVFEVTLLSYLLGLLARGGISFTAFAVVYQGLWRPSLQGTMYAQRTHFLQKLELNIITFAAILMFAESGLDVQSFAWRLRPRHEATDFTDLLHLVKKAFSLLTAAHACWLFRRVRALILDGKWCLQTSICNARDCNPAFSAEIREGYFKGCVERPVRGSLYCKHHNHAQGHRRQDPATEEGLITSHRKVLRDDGVFLEYNVGGAWLAAHAVAGVDFRQQRCPKKCR
jgi:hypothetical protein